MLGLPDRFIDHGDHARLLAAEGLDPPGIEQSILQRFPEFFGEKSTLRLAPVQGDNDRNQWATA